MRKKKFTKLTPRNYDNISGKIMKMLDVMYDERTTVIYETRGEKIQLPYISSTGVTATNKYIEMKFNSVNTFISIVVGMYDSIFLTGRSMVLNRGLGFDEIRLTFVKMKHPVEVEDEIAEYQTLINNDKKTIVPTTYMSPEEIYDTAEDFGINPYQRPSISLTNERNALRDKVKEMPDSSWRNL